MKKNFVFALLIIVCLCFFGCNSAKNIVGKWETVSLTKDNQSYDLLKSNIKISEKDGELRVNGCAGINLFICKIEVKGQKIHAVEMQNTGFRGSFPELEYEDAFFTAFMYADSYTIEDEYLYLTSSYQNAELVLKKIIE